METQEQSCDPVVVARDSLKDLYASYLNEISIRLCELTVAEAIEMMRPDFLRLQQRDLLSEHIKTIDGFLEAVLAGKVNKNKFKIDDLKQLSDIRQIIKHELESPSSPSVTMVVETTRMIGEISKKMY